MSDYIKVFNTQQEQKTFIESGNYVQPHLSCTANGGNLKYNKYSAEDYVWLNKPFTIKSLGSGNITWLLDTRTVQYSKNGGAWATMDANTTISVVQGDEIEFKGTNTNYWTCRIKSTTNYDAMGNIMSLLAGDNFRSANTVPENAFRGGMFDNTATPESEYGVVNARYLELPAMNLGIRCYMNIFRNCTNLISAPILPATTMVERCYQQIFWGCSSLANLPELPAVDLADYCYYGIFSQCGVTTYSKPLPATILMPHCYDRMFQACSNLIEVPEIYGTVMKDSCCSLMFYQCTNLISASKFQITETAEDCAYAMFFECTNLTNPPQLLATTMTPRCYKQMFQGCSSLATLPALPATTLAEECYYAMFQKNNSVTTAPDLPATTLVNNCYYGMFYKCPNLNYVKAMFTTTPSESYTYGWLNDVSATGTFVKNSAAQWDVTGTNGIPSGWTVETASA